MDTTQNSEFNEIYIKSEEASNLIDLGNFEKSFKLCEQLKDKLDAIKDKSSADSFLLFKLAGHFVDIGHMASREAATRIGLEIMQSDSFEESLTRDSYYYCLANAYRNLIQHKHGNKLQTDIKSVFQLAQVNSLLWKAILFCREQCIDAQPQYLVNLANNLKQQYRFSEALALYDEVIAMNVEIPQAWINRSECFLLLQKITNSSSIQQGKEIIKGYKNASESTNIPPMWADYYLHTANRYQKKIDEICLNEGLSLEDDDHINKKEYESLTDYRKWCLDNFLSLTEHGLYCKCYGSARDNLTIPMSYRSISGDFIYPMEKILNRLKSEFGLARLMLYEYKTDKDDLNIEDEACYSELYDNELLGINIEKLRTTFRICFGILDKIGNATASLFDLQLKSKSGKVRHSYFHSFWELENEDRLKKFEAHNNEGLIALYSIACDLNHKLEGELSFYKQWRNALEHNFVFVYENEKPNIVNTLDYYEEPVFISKTEFVESAEHVLQLTRSAIFSFVYAVRIKAEKEDTKPSNKIAIHTSIERKKYFDESEL